jgi:hypothetical protein
MERVPISLIIDDCGPVNLMVVQDPQPWRVQNVPVSFFERFIEITTATGMRGKFTVVPWPSCIARIDGAVPGYDPRELRRFMDLLREQIMPLWDITPEIITHWHTLDLKTGRFLPIREDHWAATQGADALSEYLAVGLKMLVDVGLKPNGITSPYMFGQEVEAAYSEAVGRSVRQVMGLGRSWYFLHGSGAWADVRPRIMHRTSPADVVSIVCCTEDEFWTAQEHRDPAAARAALVPRIDALLSPDGRTGRLVDVIRSGQPAVLLTHWQSLFGEGHGVGLEMLGVLGRRINEHLADAVEWMPPSRIAAMALDGTISAAENRAP